MAVSRKCAVCKAPMVAPTTGRKRKYCSDKCRVADYRKRLAARNVTALTSSDSNEWYTPVLYIEAARRTLGGFDLDPASCEEANAFIQAARYFTEQDDGLSQEWKGRVWLNPPYGRLAGAFVAKLGEEYAAGHVNAAVALISSASTSTTWFRPLRDAVLCFTDHRINFNSVKGNTTGSIFAYLGPDADAFQDNFERFGMVVTKRARTA